VAQGIFPVTQQNSGRNRQSGIHLFQTLKLIIEQHVFWKIARGTCSSWKKTLKYLQALRKSPRFSLALLLSQLSFRVWNKWIPDCLFLPEFCWVTGKIPWATYLVLTFSCIKNFKYVATFFGLIYNELRGSFYKKTALKLDKKKLI
jgi:hypothetical protein